MYLKDVFLSFFGRKKDPVTSEKKKVVFNRQKPVVCTQNTDLSTVVPKHHDNNLFFHLLIRV